MTPSEQELRAALEEARAWARRPMREWWRIGADRESLWVLAYAEGLLATVAQPAVDPQASLPGDDGASLADPELLAALRRDLLERSRS